MMTSCARAPLSNSVHSMFRSYLPDIYDAPLATLKMRNMNAHDIAHETQTISHICHVITVMTESHFIQNERLMGLAWA
jgi:hypothetical protein